MSGSHFEITIVDLAGVASIDRFEDFPSAFHPKDLLGENYLGI